MLRGFWRLLAVSLIASVFGFQSFSPLKAQSQEFAVIVDGYSSGSYYVHECKRRHIIPIHIQSSRVIPDGYWGFDPSAFERNIILDDDLSIEEVYEMLKGLNIKFVIAGTDKGSSYADKLNKLLGTRGNDPETSMLRRDKFEMGRVAGSTQQTLVSSVEEALEWYRSSGLKEIVVKVPKGGGNFGFRIVTDERELKVAVSLLLGENSTGVKKVDNTGNVIDHVLLMERMKGIVYAVNAVNIDGFSFVSEILRYKMIYKEHSDGGLSLLYDYAKVVDPNEPIVDFLIHKDRLTLDRVGFKNGISHNEYFDTDPENQLGGDADSRIKLIEVNPRVVGAGLPRLSKVSTGHDPIQIMVAAFLYPETFKKYLGGKHYSSYKPALAVSIHSDRFGKIAGTSGFSNIERLASHVMIRLETEGNIVPSFDLDSSLGMVFLSSENPDTLKSDYDVLRSMKLDEIYEIEEPTTDHASCAHAWGK